MKILVIGDSCTDVFVYGKCERLCPEAPVPVFLPKKTKKNGGMALNVFENLKSIGANVEIITNRKKIKKTRYIEEKSNQIIVRVDTDNTKFDRINCLSQIDFDSYSAVIISDYDKGFLTDEDIKFICNKHGKVFIDTKKIINENFEGVFLIKINEYEYNNNKKYGDYIDTYKDKLLVTMGANGCRLGEKIFPVDKVEIRDMSGAGDTFISTLVYKYLLTNNINAAINFANQCSTIVVQQKGVNKIGDYIKL